MWSILDSGNLRKKNMSLEMQALLKCFYLCKKCGNQDVRFPRFDDPWLLILNPEYRRGRCSEWGHVFTCIVGALMGFDKVRLIKDWSDHVWTEVLITDLNEDNGVS